MFMYDRVKFKAVSQSQYDNNLAALGDHLQLRLVELIQQNNTTDIRTNSPFVKFIQQPEFVSRILTINVCLQILNIAGESDCNKTVPYNTLPTNSYIQFAY